MRISAWGGLLVVVTGLCSCGVEPGEVPPGKLAVVGEVVLGPEDVAAVGAQLGPYAQLRFRGPEGGRGLLDALIVAELLAQEAERNGLGQHPRIEYAVLEEIAAVARTTALERQIPYASVAVDEAGLRAYYDAHRETFTTPERRSVHGVLMRSFDDAEAALVRLRSGEVSLSELGEVVATPLQARDDHEHPGFHPFLFAPGLREGDMLEHPVIVGESLLAGAVNEIEPAALQPFDDPSVHERLVAAVRTPRVQRAEAAALAELGARYPEQPATW